MHELTTIVISTAWLLRPLFVHNHHGLLCFLTSGPLDESPFHFPISVSFTLADSPLLASSSILRPRPLSDVPSLPATHCLAQCDTPG